MAVLGIKVQKYCTRILLSAYINYTLLKKYKNFVNVSLFHLEIELLVLGDVLGVQTLGHHAAALLERPPQENLRRRSSIAKMIWFLSPSFITTSEHLIIPLPNLMYDCIVEESVRSCVAQGGVGCHMDVVVVAVAYL